ncbi:UNKNOWN [Stylonychia lemnae]|uniref:Uncharacterized protein n=1 Tax=Stylonychia lemnae TaxID=5949 RepID=A0A078AIG6_STYLE|nr:UNKNOWN [Stylonychia lemnae]|eukprot:CDW82009.1 UNKNOWN [Stylonychia lemnae]
MLNFPYKLLNTEEFLKTREATTKENLHFMSSYLFLDEYQLHEGFKFAYLGLLKKIAENDVQGLREVCEKNLSQAFSDSMWEIYKDVEKIELLNEDQFPDNVKIKLIDYHQFFGVEIDRESNRLKNCQLFETTRKKIPNTDFYMPLNPTWNETLGMNLEFQLKIETNLKLNFIDKQGNSLVQNEREKEVHFMQIESVTEQYPISLKAIPMLFRNYFGKKLEFQEWIITDFDNALNRNPHVIL